MKIKVKYLTGNEGSFLTYIGQTKDKAYLNEVLQGKIIKLSRMAKMIIVFMSYLCPKLDCAQLEKYKNEEFEKDLALIGKENELRAQKIAAIFLSRYM